MGIILDADVIIRAEKGQFDLADWILSNPDEEFGIAAITVAELWHGVERASGKRRAGREAFLQSVVSVLPVFPYTAQTGLIHARIWASLESAGRMIGDYDLIVAATALERDWSVATFNAAHFGRVKGLSVVPPK